MAAKTLTGGCYRRTVSGVKSPNTPSVKHTKCAHTFSTISFPPAHRDVSGERVRCSNWSWFWFYRMTLRPSVWSQNIWWLSSFTQTYGSTTALREKTTRSLKSSQYCYCVTLEQPMSSYAGMEGTQTMHGSNALMKWMSPGAGPKVMNICSSKHYVSCARCSKRAKHARENLINVLTHHKHQKMKMKKKIRGRWIRVKEIPLWLPYNFKQQ